MLTKYAPAHQAHITQIAQNVCSLAIIVQIECRYTATTKHQE